MLDIIDSRNLIRKVNKILKTVESSVHTEVINIIAYSLAYGKVLFIIQFNIGMGGNNKLQIIVTNYS